jgi:hypothetical protein
MTGAPNVAITSGVATFDVAQTANIGVGDVIVANAISYYIASKTSTTVWNVVTNTGATPTDITSTAVTSVKHVYTSLNSAVTGASTLLGSSDLTTADVVLNIPCYYDSAADTTAVTVSGYTTDATRYIKIYTPSNTTTEANNSQRHSGKWDATKYQLAVSGNSALYTSVSYTYIQGLQVALDISVSSTNIAGIFSVSTYVKITGNIVKANNTGVPSYYKQGIRVTTVGTGVGVWNNIIYGFQYSGLTYYGGISANSAGAYVYNNTVYNNGGGIYIAANTFAKNNISYNNSLDYYVGAGAFDASSTGNLSKDASAPALNTYYRNKTLTFVSTISGGEDFHLVPADTDAINKGADLSGDANLPFTTDIDGAPRNASINAWDIGADEAATQIFRSVAPSATAVLESDTSHARTVTLTSGVATFSNALSDTIGVGDAVLIDTGGTDQAIDASDTLLFISGRNSSTSYNLQTNNGSVPSNIASNDTYQIYRAYTSIANAEEGTKNTSIPIAFNGGNRNIFTNNEQWNIACYANGTTADARAVVSGWTTGTNNYIKIYTPVNLTEVGTSQRHAGKWDDSKYKMEINANFYIYAANTRFDGIQIKGSGSEDVISYDNFNSSGGEQVVSNSIIRGGTRGIAGVRANTKIRIYNNIIYTMANAGLYPCPTDSFCYMYNNTLYNTGTYGIYTNGGTAIAKNNIVYGAGNFNTYAGTFSVGTDNNATDSTDAIGQGSNNRISQTFSFVSTVSGSEDFHLQSTDAGARNYGADMSADVNFAFATDIDGASRNASINAWDIGADETATQIFRSVGPSATAVLESDTSHARTVTLTSGVATFSNALSDTIGVGDAVIIDTGGTDQTIDASDTILFISSRNSATSYQLQANNGSVPSNITINDTYQIYRAYTSLSLAEAGTKNASIPMTFNGGDRDLVANNEQWNLACYANGTTADTTAVTVSGWITAQQDFIKIYTPVTTTEVGTSQRHNGKWDDGKYRLEYTGSFATTLDSAVMDIWVDGLQIKRVTTQNYGNIIALRVISRSKVSNNIVNFVDTYTNSTKAISNVSSDGSPSYFWNNIMYGTSLDYGYYQADAYGYVYNNTVSGAGDVGYFSGFQLRMFVKNNIAQNCVDGFLASSGNFGVGSDYNISDLSADAPGANSKNSTTVAFADSANKDFHLAPTDTAAKNSGVDLSTDANLPITTDIDGQTRSATPSWDIGADEAANAVYYSVGQSTADLKTGTPNVAITSGVATFDAAQTGNIGVGDVMIANAISYYISSKTSTTVWNVVTNTGATPANITSTAVTSIKHVYTSLNSSASGAGTLLGTTDLYTNNYQINLPCYYDSAADTAAVTVSGYTTAVPNYIKIYTPNNTSTEANNSQRHGEKYDITKYRLEVTDANGLALTGVDTKIIGLQIKLTATTSWRSAIAHGINYRGNIEIANNIIKGVLTGNITDFGLWIKRNNVNTKIYNNVIYGFKSDLTASCAGMWFGFEGGVGSSIKNVFNNTFYGNYYGLNSMDGGVTVVAKNNISYNNPYKDYNGTFDASSTNNISKDTTAPPYNTYYTNKTLSFVSTISGAEDFHLAFTDTDALNKGVDLSADTSFAFTTDIDGQTRNQNSLGWDIGVDEAATQIFYSVGQNTSDHKTGLPTVTVSGTTATFSVAQTATNMGVGDLVTYTGGICYLSAKTSTTVWSCISATGGTPTAATNATVTSIAHAFASLSAAMSGSGPGASNSSHLNTTNLVTNNYQLNIPCYYDSGADTTRGNVYGFTTGANNYIRLYTPNNVAAEVNLSQRHQGKWDDAKYRFEYTATGSSDYALYIQEPYIKIDGLQIKSSDGGYGYSAGIGINSVYSITSSNLEISNNIIKAGTLTNATVAAAGIGNYSGGKSLIYNNVIYGFNVDGSSTKGRGLHIRGSAYVYNNTFYDCYHGIYNYDGTAYAKNNIVQSATDGYAGSFTSSDYNISNLAADAPSASYRSGLATTAAFADVGNKDFHLANSDTAAQGKGVNLTTDTNLPFNVDIDSEQRGTYWSIGADEPIGVNVQTPPATSPNLGINSGLVGYWSMDGQTISGTTVKDLSGNNNNGTNNGAAQAVGKRGQALSFNGTSDYLDVGSIAMADNTSWAVSTWFYPTGSSYQALVGNTYTSSSYGRIQIRYNDLYMFYNDANGGINWNVGSGMPSNTWHHAIIICNGTDSNNLELYLDGVSLGYKTLADSGWTAKYLGKSGSSSYWSGAMDEVRVYNRAISADEVGQLYRTGEEKLQTSQTDKMTNGLVGMWSFDGADISGTTAYDRSGQGNNGTINGVTPAIGKRGQALNFNGTSDYVNISSTPTILEGKTAFTINFWAKSSVALPVSKGIFSNMVNTNQLVSDCSVLANDNYLFRVYDDTGVSSSFQLDGSDIFPDTNWHYISNVFSNGLASVYVDGVYKGISSTTIGASRSGGVTKAFRLGNGQGYWNGALDEFRIYDRALSADEIKNLYDMGQAAVK